MFDEKGKIEDTCWDIKPPIPVNKTIYKCDKRFHVEPLLNLYQNKKVYGYVLIAGEFFELWKSDGAKHNRCEFLSVKRQKHQKKGGQSAPRIERERQRKELAYIKHIIELINKHYFTAGRINVEGLFFGGPGEMKWKVAEQDTSDSGFKKHLIKICTMDLANDANTENLEKILLQTATEIDNVQFAEEQELIKELQETMRVNTDLLVFGNEITTALKEFRLATLYISSTKQEELGIKAENGVGIHIFKSRLLDPYQGMVGVLWYVTVDTVNSDTAVNSDSE